MDRPHDLARVRRHPSFEELTAKRSRYAWTLSAIMLGAYFAFILVIAFAPGVLGTPVAAGSVTSVGIPVGICLIVGAFVLTGLYVRRANGEFDRLNREIVEETR